MRKWLCLVVVSSLVTLPVAAQNRLQKDYVSLPGGELKAGNDCASEGVQYDDGSFESGYKFNSFAVTTGSYAMAFDVPPGSPGVTSVCLCWVKDSLGTETAIGYNVKVWAADGPGGSPGTVLGQSVGAAQNLSLFPSFYRTEVSLPVSGTRVWIGPEWHPSSASLTYLCADQSGPTVRPGFRSQSSGSPNEDLLSVFPNYRTLGVRAVFAPPGTCVPSETAMCLNKGRFKVEASYVAPGQPAGAGHVVKLTEETGYLWFFGSTNVEAVVKVLDACSFNQRFWVYAGGLTNVQVTLTVTDTKNGTVKQYTNPQGKAFQPIQDSSAFATCP
jgi:hypothetical protein